MTVVIEMGGAKKRSLKQAEKQQQMQTDKQQQQKEKKGPKQTKAETSERTRGLNTQEITEKDLNELAKIKALTPYAVATKYNIRLGAAKNILDTLEERKTVEQVASSGGLKIYRVIGNA